MMKLILVVDNFKLNAKCGFFGAVNTYLFQYTMVVNFNDKNVCHGDIDLFELNISSEMLMLSTEGELEPYPICEYTEVGDIFACNFFDETAPFCSTEFPEDPESPNNGTCENDVLGYYGYSLGIACEAADFDGGAQGKDDKNQNLQPKGNLNFSVNPNPFNEKIFLAWEQASEETTIRMYDNTGNLIRSFSESSYTEGELVQLNTSNLSKGIYILHIKNKTESKYSKIIKL